MPSADISQVEFAFQFPEVALRNFRLEESNPGVKLKSSTASPSSEFVASVSVQRIKKVAPFAMLSPVIVLLIVVRSAAAFPFFAPVVVVSGVTKLSAATPV
jgi:hypothetical protein